VTQDPAHPSASEPDWEALARYFAHESPPAEAVAVRAWLDAHPDDAARLTRIDAGLTAESRAPYVDVTAALAKVSARIDADAADASRPASNTTPHRASRPALRLETGRAAPRTWLRSVGLAAAAVAVFAIGLAVARLNPTAPSLASASLAPAREFHTAAGQRDSVRLEDGTRVTLGPASTLRVAAGYPTAGRALTLTGEAYFDVVHDDAHPFTVTAGAATVRDVGTTFNVRAVEPARVTVAVTSGIAELGAAAGAPVRLDAGDVGELDGGAQPVARRGKLTPRDTAWMRGRVEFHDAPLSAVAQELRRWYGIDMRLGDSSLVSRHYTGSFDREPPKDVLRIIALGLGVDVVLRGDTAFLTRSSPRSP